MSVLAPRVLCQRHAVSPSVALRIWLPGGQLTEPTPGLALACGRLLTEGTAARTWDRIVEAAERRGMDVGGVGGAEIIGLSIDALAADWREALDLGCELALGAIFPADRCEWVRRRTAAELESLAEQPEVLAGWAFMEQLYGAHPWSRPRQGDPTSLESIATASCAAFHRESMTRGLIVSVVGDLDEEAARELLERRLGAVAPPGEGGGPKPLPPAPRAAEPSRREVELPDADQAQVLLGHLTVPLAHPDFVALELASVVLGSGPGLVGRIPERVRERDGLAYAASVGTASGAGSAPGRFVVHAGTAPERVEQLIAAVREELARLLGYGIRPEELEEARRFLLGSDPFRRETARQLAVLQAQAALLGVPVDHADWLIRSVEALDRAAVESAVRRHLHPDRLVVTVGLPRSG